MATSAKTTKADSLPQCPYGARCYRKNPQHLAEFSHSKKAKLDDDDGVDSNNGPSPPKVVATSSTKVAAPSPPKVVAPSPPKVAKPTPPKLAKRRPMPSLPSVDDSDLPPCKYGANCYRKNLLHFAEFAHPTAILSSFQGGDSDSGNDTDEIADEEEPSGSSKSDDLLPKGMSLSKSFTAMSEAERKELIKKAFAAKKMLEEELKKTKEEMKKKDDQLEQMQKQVNTGLLLMEGEKEALEGNKTVYFDLVAERAYKEGSAAQTHFRLAESQFYRLLSGYGSQYRVTKVQYVVNPELNKGFKNCREELKKERGEEFSYPVLAFHGTTEKNINPICETGFKIPGQDKNHKHRTDTGWYGKGVYFSEYPHYSMGYIQGSTKLMLCQVLPGKVYNCTKLIHGAELQKGYDSHTSPDKKELVVYNKYHILPAYIVHYTTSKGEFSYKTEKTTKGKKKNPFSFDMNLFDMGKLAEKYGKALAKKKSHVLEDFTVQFSGKFCGNQKSMMTLAANHGAKYGTKAVFNLLVAARDEFDLKTSKVITAELKGATVVPEMYLYDCILQGKVLNADKYSF